MGSISSRLSLRSKRSCREWAEAKKLSTSGCATGAFRASAIGVRRFLLFTATPAAPCPYQMISCRYAYPKTSKWTTAARPSASLPNSSTPSVLAVSRRRNAKPIHSTPLWNRRGITRGMPVATKTARCSTSGLTTGFPSINTSEASNTQSCTCSTLVSFINSCVMQASSQPTNPLLSCLPKGWC